jgi:glycosyltransferase involved in cell wall biosynthesis
MINSAMVRRRMSSQPPDIVHETYYYEGRLAPRRSRVVTTVHDMIHEKFPQFFSPADITSRLKRAAVSRADHVICVSENTRTDLIALFGVDPGKVTVIHHGASTLPRPPGSRAPTDRPYVAYVGVRSGYKNFSRVLQAFGASDFLRRNAALVCFGGGDLTSAERVEIAGARLSPEQVVHQRGTDETLATVYAHAEALVYPSLYEGFGLPPLEAMGLGCPVVCSNTSSLPEVCGDAAEYFDPNSPESIAETLERTLASPDRRREMAAQGFSRRERFSWDRCAMETAGVYAKTVGHSR